MTFKDTDFYDVLFIPTKFLIMIYRSEVLSINLQQLSNTVSVAFVFQYDILQFVCLLVCFFFAHNCAPESGASCKCIYSCSHQLLTLTKDVVQYNLLQNWLKRFAQSTSTQSALHYHFFLPLCSQYTMHQIQPHIVQTFILHQLKTVMKRVTASTTEAGGLRAQFSSQVQKPVQIRPE